jgi:hypothetical protein
LADYGSGGWGFESLAARHQRRWSAPCDWVAACCTAAGLRPNCDPVAGHSRHGCDPLRPHRPQRRRQPLGGAPASSGLRRYCCSRHPYLVPPDITELPKVVADGLELAAIAVRGPSAPAIPRHPTHKRCVPLPPIVICADRCPLGGVERALGKVRFARLIHSGARILGGPAVRAAFGGNLKPAWLPRRVAKC